MRELCKAAAAVSGTKKHRSNIKWARPHLPQDLPPGTALCTFNWPPHRSNWALCYGGDHNPPFRYEEEYTQPTFSRSFGCVNYNGEILSEHSACSRVLRGLWEKHSATGKFMRLPVPEARPEIVLAVLGRT